MKKSISIWTARLIASLTILTMASGPALAVSAPLSHGPIIRLRHGTSTNWAGYAAYNGTFNNVSASWTQPSVSCTSQNTYSSYWVGLDGYNSSSVEQLGTEADCSSGSPSYYAWFEMYPKRGYYISMTVSPNDKLSASVTYSSGGRYTLSLSDSTNGQRFSTTQRANSAKRASAEAIVEAPYSGGVLPLANFGTVNFANTLVNNQPIGNFTTDRIIMVGPIIIKATTSTLDNTNEAFSVTWTSN